MKKNELIEKIKNIIEYSLGEDGVETEWSASASDNGPGETLFEIETYSPAGQDLIANVFMQGNDPESFINSFEEAYEGYDPSEETSLWLDATGHGANGAPYEVGDIYNDMKWCKKAIGRLYRHTRKAMMEQKLI